MAMQPHAQGGEIDGNALAHARMLLHEAVRACGGRVERASGGNVKRDLDVTDEAKRLCALMDRIETESPEVDEVDDDRQFSYLCQRSPGVSRLLKKLLQDGYSRTGARATIRGALRRWADGHE